MRGFFVLILLCFFVGPIGAQDFKGAGATFPTILFQKMFAQYKKSAGPTISYDPIGSGEGLAALSAGRVDFAVSDIQESRESGFSDDFVQIPVALGAVAIIYNLPGNVALKLSPAVIADIFQGKITRWDNPRIQEENQGSVLPDLPIKVLLRGDRSGTTSLLTAYLTRASNSWAEDVGLSSTLLLKNAQYTSGNMTMAIGVRDTIGAIGYTEWHYAMTYDVSIAAVRNFSGTYVQPSPTAIEASFKNVEDPQESDVYTYPITGYSYIVVARNQKRTGDIKHARSLVDLIWWMTHEGQIYADSLGFPPLSTEAMTESTKRLRGIHFDDILLH